MLRIEPYYRIVEPGQSPYMKDQVIKKQPYDDYVRKYPHDKAFKANTENRKVISPEGIQTGKNGLYETTVGRVIFNDILPEKHAVLQLDAGQDQGQEGRLRLLPDPQPFSDTVALLDRLKELGFHEVDARRASASPPRI